MKKIRAYSTALILLLAICSCEENFIPEVAPPQRSGFVVTNPELNFVITDGGSSAFKIPVGFTNISGSNRTIQLSYTSPTGAAQGVQYNAPASITIPAGKALDSLVVEGLFSGYNADRRDTLIIKITGGDGPVFSGRDSVIVYLKALFVCDVNIMTFEGEYKKSFELSKAGSRYPSDPTAFYTTSVANIVSTGPTSAEGDIINIFDYDWGPIKAQFDWSDPSNPTITIAKQATGSTQSGVFYTQSSAGPVNTFSPCDNTITISIDLLDSDGTTVLDDGYEIHMQR